MEVRLLANGAVSAIALEELSGALARAGTTVWLDFDHTDGDGMTEIGRAHV